MKSYLILLLILFSGCRIGVKVKTSSSHPRIESYINSKDSTLVEKHHLKDYLTSTENIAKKMGIKVNYLEFNIHAFNKEGKGMEGIIVEVNIPGEKNKIFQANKDGIATFTLSRNILEKDPICILKGGFKYEMEASITTKPAGG